MAGAPPAGVQKSFCHCHWRLAGRYGRRDRDAGRGATEPAFLEHNPRWLVQRRSTADLTGAVREMTSVTGVRSPPAQPARYGLAPLAGSALALPSTLLPESGRQSPVAAAADPPVVSRRSPIAEHSLAALAKTHQSRRCKQSVCPARDEA